MKRKSKVDQKNLSLGKGALTPRQVKIIHSQIRLNTKQIEMCISTIDLLINKEQCPKDANTLLSLRKRLDVAMSENDTFRKVLWRQVQIETPAGSEAGDEQATAFLANRINTRRKALIAQKAMK